MMLFRLKQIWKKAVCCLKPHVQNCLLIQGRKKYQRILLLFIWF